MDHITDMKKDSEIVITENETSNDSITSTNSGRRKDMFVNEHNPETQEERHRYGLHDERGNSEYADNDDEVVEITEIREITHRENKVPNESANDGNKNNDTSSIEYLLNSIRILNNEKSDLQNSLNGFKKLNDRNETKIKSYKQSMSILNKNYSEFEKELSKYKMKMFNLTKSNNDLKSNIGKNLHDINDLKSQLQICIADDKSNKSVIDSLYQKIDNLSGNLSESKLKNDQMENELNVLRSKLENKLEDIVNGNDKKFENVESLINRFNESMNVSNNLIKIIDSNNLLVLDKTENNFNSTFTLIDKININSNNFSENFQNEIFKINLKMNDNSKNLIEEFKILIENINFKDLTNKFDQFEQNLKDNFLKYQEINKELNLKIDEINVLNSIIKLKDKELNEFKGKNESINVKIEEMNNEDNLNKEEIKKKYKEINEFKKEIKNLNEILKIQKNDLISNYENKIKIQKELLILSNEEKIEKIEIENSNKLKEKDLFIKQLNNKISSLIKSHNNNRNNNSTSTNNNKEVISHIKHVSSSSTPVSDIAEATTTTMTTTTTTSNKRKLIASSQDLTYFDIPETSPESDSMKFRSNSNNTITEKHNSNLPQIKKLNYNGNRTNSIGNTNKRVRSYSKNLRNKKTN
ncbi:unnamed protein product [[Candida] boidinii]|uniref:Unnamed protein product n=1 Tax=Candida boidinii TaxID=5477 RepID=A0A9W6T2M0_CANBO|nr:unnamed protein product [[Candida] boidinii]